MFASGVVFFYESVDLGTHEVYLGLRFSQRSLLVAGCDDTAEVLPSVSKVAGVWRSLFWCLESVMLWRGIMGFTKFGDKRVNDLDLLSG